MRFDVVVEPQAERDIRPAALGILGRSGSRTTAGRWARSLRTKIATLKSKPYRCPIDPDSEVFGEDVRVSLHGKRGGVFRGLCAVRGQTVHVLSVRHSAQATLTDEPAEDSGPGP